MKKYIKYFLKFIEKLIFPFEAKPIIKINEISEDNVALAINTKQNKKKTFYIIKRTPGAGLFSNFIFVLNHLKIAESCGYIQL